MTGEGGRRNIAHRGRGLGGDDGSGGNEGDKNR